MRFHSFHPLTEPGKRDGAEEFLPYSTARQKEYPRFPRVALPAATPTPMPLEEALALRKSARAFGARPLSFSHLSTLLASARVHEERSAEGVSEWGEPARRRFYPSAGALYPIELYVAVRQITGLPCGLYHYDPRTHELEAIADAIIAERLLAAMPLFPLGKDAACVVYLTAVWHRASLKYGEMAYRTTLLEAGHLAQNIVLSGTAHGIATCTTAGVQLKETDELLDLSMCNENTVYAIAAGTPV